MKINRALAIFAATETTASAGAAMSATNVIQVAGELPLFTIDYSNKGDRGMGQMTGGKIQPTSPGGRTAAGTIKVEAKGIGSGSYTVSNLPPNLGVLMNASGFSSSLAGGNVVFAPRPVSNTSATCALAIYNRGEVTPVSGAMATMGWEFDGASPVTFTFDVQGTAGDTIDIASVPSRTWQASGTLPPKCESVSLTLGSFATPNVRKGSFSNNSTMTPRLNVNSSTGHSGFAGNFSRDPKLNLTIEAEALATFDPRTLMKNATAIAVSMTVGTVALNRFTHAHAQATITNVTDAVDGDVALWELEITPFVTNPDQDNDTTITFN